jgi:hypothetical protein
MVNPYCPFFAEEPITADLDAGTDPKPKCQGCGEE